jgi:crotonobetainyl-CoA:carnitine CoA-transferase CaiB-like acyl-CoA transferase
VLDLTSGPAGGIATMILADFGADVLMVERPGGSPFDGLPAARMWRRGKRSLALDLGSEAGLTALHELCAAADVLVCNWRRSALERKGLHFDALHARHPHLVFCHISGFGSRGPRADVAGYEHVVAAASGRMRVFAGICDRDGPVFSALQVGVHACAQSAAAGILAALLERGVDGAGRCVETSMLQGMLPYEQGAMLGAQFRSRHPDVFPALPAATGEPPMPSLYYHPAQAADGRWLQFGNLLPHLFDGFLRVADLMEVLADPDYDQAQMLLRQPAKHEAFRQRMLERIQSRTAAEWMADCIADGGVVATAYQTTQQALSDPDIVANGHVIARADGGVQLGPLARMTQTPAAPGGDATAADAAWLAAWRAQPKSRPARPRRSDLPLAGVRVVELATIIAAPLAAAYLADMGADVVKVEQIGGDPYRGMGVGTGSARVNAGKRSLSIDLKSEQGRGVVLDLVRDADLLIHNFRPGVPERLGIGYEQVRALNERIVYLQSNGYGPDGPGALRPSTHPIPGAAMGGVLYQLGERVPQAVQDMAGLRLWTRRLMRANEVNPDPNTALVITTAAVLGLVARQRTGRGQQIFVDMFGANAYANSDDFLAWPGKPPRALPDAGLHGLGATYRLYRCAGDEWVFLALLTSRERATFARTLAAAGVAAPAPEVLAAGGEAAAGALGALFATRPAQYWDDLLSAAGIGCVRADGPPPSEFWLNDPQSQALGLTAPAEHPRYGPYRRHGRVVTFDGDPPPPGPPPLAGQHNDALLRARGHDDAAIAALYAAGVLYRED